MTVIGRDIPGPPDCEDRFTEPTALCPHPEHWTSTDGDSTEVEVSALVGGLVRGLQPDYCVETGAAWGQTSEAIGRALSENGHGRLVTIEVDPVRAGATALRCVGLPVAVFHGHSMGWTPEGIIDFAFFDSFYELRVPEFQAMRPFMRRGTIVAFHDSAPEHGSHRIPSGRDLRCEIDAELGEALRFIHLPTPRGITIGEVM